MVCYLCGMNDHFRRPGRVRDNEALEVLECRGCGLVFLSSFDHVYENYYEQSGMHATAIDVPSWLRQSAQDDERRFDQFRRCIENKSVLDFGCGAGGFLMHARTVAARVCGVEIEQRLVPHFAAEGLDVRASVGDFDERFDLITLFHVVEHFADPAALLKELAGLLKPGGRIIVEVPSADDALLTLFQCKPFSEFTYWGCHLFLFNGSTMPLLVSKAGCTVEYLKYVQRYTPANHLYWLSQGRPGGHAHWHFLDTPELSAAYEKSLAAIGRTDTIICSLIPGGVLV